MLKLKEIVQQMDAGIYNSLQDEFAKNKAKNSGFLLEKLRSDEYNEKEICEKLGLTNNAFYALKSRLLDKIQNHMPVLNGFSKEELINTLARIPEICSTNPRETANALLQKLENDLKVQGMHNELLSVYSALKRINMHTQKYYTYSQQYNKQVAYMISLEKADEVAVEFSKLASTYVLSKDAKHIDALKFLAQKIDNIHELNPSKQILFIRNTIHAQFMLFCQHDNESDILKLLNECQALVQEATNDNVSASHQVFIDFLYFEYYVSQKKFKSAEPYYQRLKPAIKHLPLHNYIGCLVPFLGSTFYYCQVHAGQNELVSDTSDLLYDPADIHNCIALNYYNALNQCKAGNNKSARSILLKTINDYSLQGLLSAEIEVKFLLSFILAVEKEYDLADDYLKKIIRKIKSLDSEQFIHVDYLARFFDLIINKESNAKNDQKRKELFTLFLASNKGEREVMRAIVPLINEHYKLQANGL